MTFCAHTKADGTGCKGTVASGAAYCWAHDPANAQKRKQNAAKGGKTAGNGRVGTHTELIEIRGQLKALLAAAIAEKYDRGTIAVCNQLLNSRLRLVELEHKLVEAAELESRLEALEALAQEQAGTSNNRSSRR